MPDATSNDQALIDFTCSLVRLRSVLGNENNVADRVSREMRRLLFDQVKIDDVGNAVGVIRGLQDGPLPNVPDPLLELGE